MVINRAIKMARIATTGCGYFMIFSFLDFLRFIKRAIRAGIITGEITVYLEKLSNVYDTAY